MKHTYAEVDLNLLLTGMLFLAVAGIAGAYSLSIEQSVKADVACSNASAGFTYNESINTCANSTGATEVMSLGGTATNDAQAGIANVTGQFDLIGTILVAVVILGLIFMLFQFVKT